MKIHDGRKMKDPNRRSFNFILFYQNNRKFLKKFLIFAIFIAILFFPSWSGQLIGEWIRDFIGTILNIIKTI